MANRDDAYDAGWQDGYAAGLAKSASALGVAEQRAKLADILGAQVQLLREAHEEANGPLRSAWSIAEREGRGVNWAGFRETLRHSLEVSHAALNALRDCDERGGGRT